VIGLVVAQNLDSGDTPGQTTDPVVTSSSQQSSAEQTTAEQTSAEETTPEETTPEETTPEETTTTTATTTTPPPEEETVLVDPEVYFGQPLEQVTTALEELGLVPVPREVPTQGVDDGQIEEGTVGQVSPAGEQPVGTEIDVPYAVPVGDGGGGGDG
jgi:cytoskeletal protein RodZ